MKVNDEKFWQVIGPALVGAKKRTYAAAATEAEGLAQSNPGETYTVLGAETAFCAAEMQRVEYIDPIDLIRTRSEDKPRMNRRSKRFR
jgi:hypothetical protein